MYPSKSQQQAIEAKLNFMLGAEVYDRLFIGFVCGHFENDKVSIFVQNENCAAVIESEYRWHLALIVESVLKKPIKFVNVLPKALSN